MDAFLNYEVSIFTAAMFLIGVFVACIWTFFGENPLEEDADINGLLDGIDRIIAERNQEEEQKALARIDTRG
jgi:hypothetical protein